MKIFSFIFSIYLLLLSVQPCQDLAASGFSYLQTENEQTQLHEEEDTQEETHECSPFCICSCRQMSVIHNFPIPAEAKEILVFTRTFSNIESQNNYSPQYFDSIWQPPKFNFTV